ncbi:MAG: hypothetical protein HYW37_01875 [Candidatus Colwellbacteria bacterium]|nr:hypothetical protein [Candidatus Colwellbacteria bacterium]
MSSKILLLGASLSFTVIVLLPQNQALAVVGHNCLYDNKCDSGEVCATVVKMPTGTVTQCYNIDSIPDGASILITNEQTIKQVCSLIPNSTSRFPDSCKPAPTPPPGATNVQCKSDEVGVLNPATGLIGSCQKKLPPSATVAPLTPQGSGLLFKSNNCSIDVGSVSANFLGDVIGDGGKAVVAKLIAQKGISGTLANIPIVGGLVEGFDKIVDFILSSWLTAVSWGLFATLLAAVTAALTQYALTLNAAIATSNSVVGVGFGIILALVNMGFVAGIVVIALATMLRREEWGLKNLPRFILAALLVNFSLFFAGAILNAGSEVIKAFLNGGACTGNFFTKFNIVTINQTLENVAKASGGVEGMVLSVTSLYIAALLTFIGALSFAAIFLFLIARYVAVTILLIFMPIAWLGFAFPKLNFPLFGSAWSGWWNEFIKWVITGPVIAFFIYLSTYLISNLSSINVAGGGPIVVIGQMIAVVAISLGGLYAASKMSGVGSAVITGAMGLGLGATAGQWTKFMQRQQLAAETRSKLHPTGVRGFWEKGLAKSFGATAGAPGLIFAKPLAQAGIKLPEGKKLTEGERRAERAKQILGMFDARFGAQPMAVLQLTNDDITQFSRHGSPGDRDKINTALAHAAGLPLTPQQIIQWNRIDGQITRLRTRHEWE